MPALSVSDNRAFNHPRGMRRYIRWALHKWVSPVKVTSELPGKGNLLDAMLKSGLAMVSAAGLYATGLHCDSEATNSEHLWLTLD